MSRGKWVRSREQRYRVRPTRGIALITALLAVALLMTIVMVLVNIGTSRLRHSAQDLRSLQAIAAADAGAAWVRALLDDNHADMSATLKALALAHSTLRINVAASAYADVVVTLQVPAPATHTDHLDSQLQENPQILETPMQVAATASLYDNGTLQATRTVTTLLRIFHQASPFSEVVGVIDDGGPVSINSPGDPAGQFGGAYATELRLHVYKNSKPGSPTADNFKNQQWWDDNSGANGFLP